MLEVSDNIQITQISAAEAFRIMLRRASISAEELAHKTDRAASTIFGHSEPNHTAKLGLQDALTYSLILNDFLLLEWLAHNTGHCVQPLVGAWTSNKDTITLIRESLRAGAEFYDGAFNALKDGHLNQHSREELAESVMIQIEQLKQVYTSLMEGTR